MATAARHMPLLEPAHLVGALWAPPAGHVDPAGVTRAYARAAQLMGAEIWRFPPVREEVPLLAMQQHDLVTEALPEVAARTEQLPRARLLRTPPCGLEGARMRS